MESQSAVKNESLGVPAAASQAVLVTSSGMPAGSVSVEGYDFNKGVNYEQILASYLRVGYQATNFGLAVEEIKRMLKWRLSDEPVTAEEHDDLKVWGGACGSLVATPPAAPFLKKKVRLSRTLRPAPRCAARSSSATRRT